MCLQRRKRNDDGESKKALDEARQNVTRAKARDPEVQEVASALRSYREHNHFAEQLLQMMTLSPPREI